MLTSVREQLLRYADKYASTYLTTWSQLAAHLGKESHETIRLLGIQLQQRGFSTSLYSQSPRLYGSYDTGAYPTLFVYNRCMSPEPSLWEVLPAAALLAALDIYKKVLGNVPVNIKYLLDEGGEKGASALAAETVLSKEALGADCCLWDVTAYREEVLGIWPIERNSPLLALGTKGLLRVELYTQTATVLPPALYGTIVPNAIWRLLWALNSLKDVREEVLIEGFYDTLRPANDEIVEQLYTLPDPARLLAERWGMKQLLLGLQGFQLHYAHLLTPTCTVRSFTDGTSSSQELSDFLPTVAGAQVDFSLVPEQSPADIFAKLQRHLHEKGFADIQVRQVKATPPIQTTFTTSFTQLIYQATSEANGHEPILLPIAPSSTPDALAQSLPPIVITAQCGPQDEEQRKDENIAVQYLAKAIKQMVLIFFLLGSKS